MRLDKMSLFGLVLSFSTATLAKPITIGIAGPFSGANAAFGEQMFKGASQAIADINAKGGINGEQLALVKSDDACDPKQAVQAAHKLVDQDKVSTVVGHFCSSSTLPASTIYADADVTMITPAATNPAVTDRGLNDVFRICGRDDSQGPVAAEFIANTLKAKRVAVVHDKDTYGKGLADAMKAKLESMNIKPVFYDGLTRGEKDFNAIVTKIKAAHADAVYFGGLHIEGGLLLRQLREQGLKIPFVSGDGIVTNEFVTEVGGTKDLTDVYMTFGKDPRNLSSGKVIVEAFRKNGYEPEGYTLYSYAAVQAIAKAMQETHKTDGKDISEWLHHHPVDTVMGELNWDEKGDLKGTEYVMYQWDTSGHYAEVK